MTDPAQRPNPRHSDHAGEPTVSLHYDLQKAGWATVTLTIEGEAFAMTTSYLHDSLLDLATAALAMLQGEAAAEAIFMDEPGETHLHLHRARRTNPTRPDAAAASDGAGLAEPVERMVVELVWHDDWTSWGIVAGTPTRLCGFEIEVVVFARLVLDEMERLLRAFGVAGYKERWGEHDFPTQAFEALMDHLTA